MPSVQQQLPLVERGRWGGARPGAGRKREPGRRSSVEHRSRPKLDPRHPLLVTLRARDGIVWLRSRLAYRALEGALAASSRHDFRVVHFSVQSDHLHLIAEADGELARSRGLRGVAIRCALAVNRAVGRTGRVWGERYHASALRTPRMVRNALVYVLANGRKHGRVGGGLDPCSSAQWFDGFREPRGTAKSLDGEPDPRKPTDSPRTWLLRVGWRRHGLLSPDETPAAVRARAR